MIGNECEAITDISLASHMDIIVCEDSWPEHLEDVINIAPEAATYFNKLYTNFSLCMKQLVRQSVQELSDSMIIYIGW